MRLLLREGFAVCHAGGRTHRARRAHGPAVSCVAGSRAPNHGFRAGIGGSKPLMMSQTPSVISNRPPGIEHARPMWSPQISAMVPALNTA